MAFQFEEDGRLKKKSAEELAALDADSFVIVLDRGTDMEGRPYWAYIAVKPSKFEEFMRLTETGENKIFADYGTILKYGYDKEVPAHIKEEMKREHNCDENYMENLKKEVHAAQMVFLEEQENNRISGIVAMLKKKQ